MQASDDQTYLNHLHTPSSTQSLHTFNLSAKMMFMAIVLLFAACFIWMGGIKIIVAIVLLLAAVYIWMGGIKIYSIPTGSFPPLRCPVSVNYHYTRQCNKYCGLCFHTALTSHKQDLTSAKHGLRLLKEAGMRKLNFAGGEPFLYPKFLGALIDYCKEELQLESVSIVTNGSLVTESFLTRHGRHIDILAVSCNSFNEQTNIEIGRGSGNQADILYKIEGWCQQLGIKFSINTVVCKLNVNEDMNEHLSTLQPFRWKCSQVLMLAGENDSDQTLRDIRKFIISDQEYKEFCRRHRHQPSFVPENNQVMAHSYLILDEYMRLMGRDGRKLSPSILEVGVQKALSCIVWDEEEFKERGGLYDWQRVF